MTEAGIKKGVQRSAAARSAMSAVISEGLSHEVALDGFWDTISSPFKKAGSAVKDAAKKVGSTAKSWTITTGKFLGKTHCYVAGSKAAEIAGAAVASYYGVPPQVGVAGVKMSASMCPEGQVAIPEVPPPGTIPPPNPFTTTPPWLLPAAIGVGGIAVVFLLTR
jgi:hypothetical protein